MKRFELLPVEGVLRVSPVIGVLGVDRLEADRFGVAMLLPPHFRQRGESVPFVVAEFDTEFRPALRG